MAKRLKGRATRVHELVRRLPPNHSVTGAEIGVKRGKMSADLLAQVPTMHLYLVDAWDREAYASREHENFSHPQTEHEKWRLEATARTEFANERRTILWGFSDEMAKSVKDECLDFIFIDTGHTEPEVYRDLCAWVPKVRKGGLLGGHDIDHEEHPEWGVRQAVERYFAEQSWEIEPEVAGNHTWWALKPR